jgi:hypothetical protein
MTLIESFVQSSGPKGSKADQWAKKDLESEVITLEIWLLSYCMFSISIQRKRIKPPVTFLLPSSPFTSSNISLPQQLPIQSFKNAQLSHLHSSSESKIQPITPLIFGRLQVILSLLWRPRVPNLVSALVHPVVVEVHSKI